MKGGFLSIIVVSQIASSQDVKISDFQIPETKAVQLIGGFGANALRKVDETDAVWLQSSGALSQRESFWSGSVTGDLHYSNLQIHEDYTFDLSARADLGWYYYYSQQASIYVNPGKLRKDRTRTNSQSVHSRIDGEGLYYLVPDRWFTFGSVLLDGEYQMTERNEKSVDSTFSIERNDLSRAYGYDAFFALGAGFGKIRDGKDVFVVLRILENLAADGALLRDLSHGEILHLVSIVARRVEYQTNYERFLKYFFRDFMDALEQMGVLHEAGVDSYATLRSLEVLSERIQPRLFGYTVRAGVEHASSQSTWKTNHFSEYERSGLDRIVLQANYGMDLSLFSHTSAVLFVKVPLVGRRDRVIDVSLSGRFSYEMSERIEFIADYGFAKIHDTGLIFSWAGPSRKNVFHQLNGALYFFIENRVNLSVGASYLHQTVHTSSETSVAKETNASLGASVTVNYRFF